MIVAACRLRRDNIANRVFTRRATLRFNDPGVVRHAVPGLAAARGTRWFGTVSACRRQPLARRWCARASGEATLA